MNDHSHFVQIEMSKKQLNSLLSFIVFYFNFKTGDFAKNRKVLQGALNNKPKEDKKKQKTDFQIAESIRNYYKWEVITKKMFFQLPSEGILVTHKESIAKNLIQEIESFINNNVQNNGSKSVIIKEGINEDRVEMIMDFTYLCKLKDIVNFYFRFMIGQPQNTGLDLLLSDKESYYQFEAWKDSTKMILFGLGVGASYGYTHSPEAYEILGRIEKYINNCIETRPFFRKEDPLNPTGEKFITLTKIKEFK